MAEGLTVSQLAQVTVKVDLSERMGLEVIVPLHRFELNNDAFMSPLLHGLRAIVLPMSSEMKTFDDMLQHCLKQIVSAVSGLTNLPIKRVVKVSMLLVQPYIKIDQDIHIRRDGLPEFLCNEHTTNEELVRTWISYREKCLLQVTQAT